MSDKEKITSKDVEKNAEELSEDVLNNVVGGVYGEGNSGCTDHNAPKIEIPFGNK